MRISFDRVGDLSGRDGSEQSLAEVLPSVLWSHRRRIRKCIDVPCLSNIPISLREQQNAVEGLGTKFAARIAIPNGLHPRLDYSLENRNLLGEVGRAFDLNAVLEPQVKQQRILELDDLALERVMERRLGLFG